MLRPPSYLLPTPVVHQDLFMPTRTHLGLYRDQQTQLSTSRLKCPRIDVETRAYRGIPRQRIVTKALIVVVINETGHRPTSRDQRNIIDIVVISIIKQGGSALETEGSMVQPRHSTYGLYLTPRYGVAHSIAPCRHYSSVRNVENSPGSDLVRIPTLGGLNPLPTTGDNRL